MELLTKKCPACRAKRLTVLKTYATKAHGLRLLYRCQACALVFSETKHTFLEGLKTPVRHVWQVLEARTAGLGLNATVEVFQVAKNTILAWERKFRSLHEVLVLYALTHRFLQAEIEGDEAYTKVHHTVPPEESVGWTIALQDRASRFLWE